MSPTLNSFHSFLLTLLLVVLFSSCKPSGDAETLFNQGRALERGEGIATDLTKARSFYLEAARLGHPKAQHNLAMMLWKGNGGGMNKKEAFVWFQKAAENGAVLSQQTVGNIFESGFAGQPEDPAKALLWYRKAATQGVTESQYRLANLSYFQFLSTKNSTHSEECLKWAQTAADQGHAAAENLMGVLAEEGIGGPRNYPKALEWYEKAAAKEQPQGLGNAGRFYMSGLAPKKDIGKAYHYLTRGTEKMDLNSLQLLKELWKGPLLNDEQKKHAWDLIERFETANKRDSDRVKAEPE